MYFKSLGTDNGEYQADFVVSGSGGLARLHGSGTYSGQDQSGLGSYTIRYVL